MSQDRWLVLGTRSYRYMQQAICTAAGFDRGEVDVQIFPDGERYQRIACEVAGQDVAIVGGTISDTDTLELYDLACAVVKYGAHRLTLVIPFFGYSTMDRAVLPSEVVTAKTRARLISTIPPASSGTKVILMDLHSEGLPHYFEGEITPVHIYAKPVIHRAARNMGGSRFVIACTDAGRAKWVESLANDLGVNASFVFKRRIDAEHTEVTAVSAHVQGENVVIYDDMIRTGSSLLNAAVAYANAGARSIGAIATHGVFPGNSLERLRDSGLFSTIVCTDTHPRAIELSGDFLKVESVAGLLAEAIATR